MNTDNGLDFFVVECQELLQLMEDSLIGINNNPDIVESIADIFRSAYTIKGTAGIFSLDGIVAFAHVVESMLDRVRAGHLKLDENMITLLLACKDHIGELVASIDDGKLTIDDEKKQIENKLTAQLYNYIESSDHFMAEESANSSADNVSTATSPIAAIHNENWHISVRFKENVLRDGMDPLSFLRYLGKIGNIKSIVTICDALPAAEEMDPESCYLAYEINFYSDADKETIENVFEFVWIVYGYCD